MCGSCENSNGTFLPLSQPYLLTGILYTLLITALGLGGGLVMAIVLASMQLSRFPVLALITRAYAIIFRGTPLILQMIFCYNALPMIGIKLTAIEAAGLALALNEAPKPDPRTAPSNEDADEPFLIWTGVNFWWRPGPHSSPGQPSTPGVRPAVSHRYT